MKNTVFPALFCTGLIIVVIGGCSSPPPADDDALTVAPTANVAAPDSAPVVASGTPVPGSRANPLVNGVPLLQLPTTGGSAYATMPAGPFDASIKENVEESVETDVVNPNHLPDIDPATQEIVTDEAGRTILKTKRRRSLTGKVVLSIIRLTPFTYPTTTHVFGTVSLTNQSLYPASDLQVVFFHGDLPTVLLGRRQSEPSNPTNASALEPGETRQVTINTVCAMKPGPVSYNQRLSVEAQLSGPPGRSIYDTEVSPVDYDVSGNIVGSGIPYTGSRNR